MPEGYTLRLETVLLILRDTELAKLSCEISFSNGKSGKGYVVAKQGKWIECQIDDENQEVSSTDKRAYQILDSEVRRWSVNVQGSMDASSFQNVSSLDIVSSHAYSSPMELSHQLGMLLTNPQGKSLEILIKEVTALVKALSRADFCSLEFSSEVVKEERTSSSMTIPLKLENEMEQKYFGKLFCRWHLVPPVEAEVVLPMVANWISLYAASRVFAPKTLPFFQALLAKHASRDQLIAQANIYHIDLLQQPYVIVLAYRHTGTLEIVQQVISSLPMLQMLFVSDPYLCALIPVIEARIDQRLQAKLANSARISGPLIAMGLPTAYSTLPFPENFRESALHAAAALLELSFQQEHVFFSYRDDYQYYYRLQSPPIATTHFLYQLEHLERSEKSNSRLLDVLEVYLFSPSNQKEMAEQLGMTMSTYLRRFAVIEEECKKNFQVGDPKIIPTMQAAMAIYRQRTRKQMTPEELLRGLLHL